MLTERLCEDCGQPFTGHRNRTRCVSCANKRLRASREKYAKNMSTIRGWLTSQSGEAIMKQGVLFPCRDFVPAIGMKSDVYRNGWGNYRVEATGEFRAPQAGEWFISGAEPEGFYAPNGLPTDYHIGRLVLVSVQTIVKTLVIARW